MPKNKTSSETKKQRVAASHVRGEQRKAARRAAQDKAKTENRQAVKEGGMTPWQQAKAARRQSRSAARAGGK